MLNKNDIREIVSDTVFGFDLNTLGDDQDFKELGIDSLDHINILLGIEEKHGVKIPDDMVDQCRSINNILKFLNK